MKNEIKEILDKLKDKNNYISHSMILLSIKETTTILDYITNLQQIEQDHQKLNGELREENKRLNNIINEFKNMKKELLDYIYHNEYSRFGYIDGGEADEMREIISKTDTLKKVGDDNG